MNQTATINQNVPSPYKIVKQIGSGSFGNVYLVINTNDNRQSVIKQLHPISNQPNFIKQARRLFRQEADILKKLSHPQIPQLIDYFEEDGEFYLVEEYIEGDTLRQELTINQPWAEAKVIRLLQEGLSILQGIHSQGVIHRDVKPDNFIRRQQDGKLVLIDFGAVKEFNIEQSRLIDPTVALTVSLGTPGYMPIEQALGKPRKNSDIYALGMIAIQALIGKNPMDFSQDEEGEIIWRNQGQVNPKLADILTNMTRYHYKQRYQSAEEVLPALNQYQQTVNHSPSIVDSPINSLPQNNPNPLATTSPPSLISPSSEKVKPTNESSDSISLRDWLKSPLGSTITTAVTIGLIATAGAYFMNVKDKDRIEQEKQDLINSLQDKYNRQAYIECFEDIEEKIEEDNDALTNKAREYLGKCRLAEAKKKAQIGNYTEALETAAQILSNDVYYDQAQLMIRQWSEKVFTKAKRLYTEEGDLEKAKKEIDTIPDNPVRQAALINLRKWQEEYDRNSYLRTQAERDLEYENCTAAIETAGKIYGSNYWLLEGKKIVDKGKKCLEDQGKILITQPRSNPGSQYRRKTPRGTLDICRDNNPLCSE